VAVSFETASIKQDKSAGGGSFVGRRPLRSSPADPNSPSLVTALQEQLGKLGSTRGPVEVFVIDRVERPTED
jgi:uncharacterized protein (TIGR03435 family)